MIEGLLIYLRLQDKQLSLFLTDNKGITRLNKRYFNKDKPTNVISFSYMENGNHTFEENIIGDIAISVEMADYEANISGCSFSERLVELIIHGIVHILGFDHERGAKEARRMRYMERKLLKYISQQNVYREFVLEKR
ncbi:MAG TPA: rRNA maturation RNase YbeY [Syntrophorhabdaceae bacterium]|nr:rRNA maturation RNase YbeY [Syntrophorhabdaceae bacterium]HPU30146.1 rRNA maturation RNase YbeY [Syntrophorhabdaceae bacterium]